MGAELAVTTNVVNLDALIRREDLAAPGEDAGDIDSLPIMGLEPRGALYPSLRKPDFQRETASWSPEQVADLIATFAKRELIPSVILWRAGSNVFIIDGAHRLSALIAWVHNDYGDGEVSRKFFSNAIPESQSVAAAKTRQLVEQEVGSYEDHKKAIDNPNAVRADIAARALKLGWQNIDAQWIRNADLDKAEKAFFRVNKGGTKIDPKEQLILSARKTPTALSARAILRKGTGHNYWKQFGGYERNKIEELGKEVFEILFEPYLHLPIKTLDIPVAGHGYGPHVLPFLFDLVNLVNDVPSKGKALADEDKDGSKTIKCLSNTRAVLRRISSAHPSSLGLHPALYFYSQGGVFQPAALLSFIALIKAWDTPDFIRFTDVRMNFEQFLLTHRGVTDAIRELGSGSRSRPRIVALYARLIERFAAGESVEKVAGSIASEPGFGFIASEPEDDPTYVEATGEKFNRSVKGGAFLRQALPSAVKCAKCGGLIHRNGIQVGHKHARRDGGSGQLSNAQLEHPLCNSTVQQ
jgi:hypothetical protein